MILCVNISATCLGLNIINFVIITDSEIYKIEEAIITDSETYK